MRYNYSNTRGVGTDDETRSDKDQKYIEWTEREEKDSVLAEQAALIAELRARLGEES